MSKTQLVRYSEIQHCLHQHAVVAGVVGVVGVGRGLGEELAG